MLSLENSHNHVLGHFGILVVAELRQQAEQAGDGITVFECCQHPHLDWVCHAFLNLIRSRATLIVVV